LSEFNKNIYLVLLGDVGKLLVMANNVRRDYILYIKAKNYKDLTIADELTSQGEWVDGVMYGFDEIEISYNDMRKSDFYTSEQGHLNLGKILYDAFGENDIKIIDTETKRIFAQV